MINAMRCFALLIAFLLLLPACNKEEEPQKQLVRPVRAVKIEEQAFPMGVEIPGRAKATREVNLSFRVPGRVINRPVFVGDEVAAGQMIAELDPRDFKNELLTAQGQLGRAQAEVERASSDYQRIVKIRKQDPGAASVSLLERKREALDSAKAQISSRKARVAKAKDQLDDTKLKAPYAGWIVATYVENFEDVTAKQPVVRLVDISRIEMTINIPENGISYLPRIKYVYVTFDAFPDKEIRSEIKEVGTEASQTTRTYPVVLIMDQPEGAKILPGMAGKTKRVTYKPGQGPREREGFVVPATAIFTPDASGRTYVWIIGEQDKMTRLQEVQTKGLSNDGIIITGDVKPGQWIATAGVNHLEEGQQVSILPASKAGPK